jgi:TRAP-type uncharacterized transport system substrate-binding protein
MLTRRWVLKLSLAIAGVALLGIAAYNYAVVYCCGPVRLTISGGNVCPLRTEMAAHICREVHNSDIILHAVGRTNSHSIAADVNAGRLDLGIVLGGLSVDAYPNVRQVATLGVEPLHLLVRADLGRAVPPSLELLRGRRVSLGEQGSNGAILAADLLRFAGFKPSTPHTAGDFTADYTSEADLHKRLGMLQGATPSVRAVVEASLPDAVFLVDSMPSHVVDEMVQIGGYKLIPLPYAAALQLDNRRDHERDGHRLESSRLEAVTIPAFTYGIDPAMPSPDCSTIGLRLLLVAHDKTPSSAIVQLLRALDHSASHHGHVSVDAATDDSEFPLHQGTIAFAKDRRPISASQFLEPLTDLLSVLGAGAAGALALWGFLRGLRAVNPDVHLRQIDRIERLLQGSEADDSAPSMPLDFIAYLETRLAQIKQAAIEDYAHGRFRNDDALVSILTLTADTRHLLVQRRKQLAQEPRPVRISDAA